MTETPAVLPPSDEFAPVSFGDHFRIGPNGLEPVRGTPSFETCHQFWTSLRSLERGLQFAMGDTAKYLRERFGEKADQIISGATGWSYETVRAYEWTAEKVLPEARHMDTLTYSHHQAVAKLAPRAQRQWLGRAASGDGADHPWSVSKLKAAIKADDAAAAPAFYLLVKCASEAAQERLAARLEQEGFVCSRRGGG